jgi:hypothetical protein
MREFQNAIFAGQLPAIYRAHVKKLNRIVAQALVVQGGLQQPPRSDSEKEAKRNRAERLILHKELADMRADIDTALGGNSAEVIRLARQLLFKGCDATTCGIRYDECNGAIVVRLKKLLGIKE